MFETKPQIDPGTFGKALVVKGNWTEDHLQFMLAHDIRELVINQSRGFKGESLDFLKEVPFLEGLEIFFYSNVDLSPIQFLPNLRSFINGTDNSTKFDFTVLPRLERLGFGWHKGVNSLFNCVQLKRLYLNPYPAADLSEFRLLRNLEQLGIVPRKITSLSGITAMENSGELSIYEASQLTSLDGVQNLHKLKYLYLETCKKVSNLEPLSYMESLEKLAFVNCGDIDSLQPIVGLSKLKMVSFAAGTNIVDGDISYLDRLPELSAVYFRNRKHYSAKCEKYPPRNNEKVVDKS